LNILWPPTDGVETEKAQKMKMENSEFKLEEAVNAGDATIFSHSVESLKNLFLDGRKLNSSDQIRLVESFKVKEKI